MIRKQVFIEDQQNEELKRLANQTGQSEGHLVREAIDRWLAERDETENVWNALLER